MAITGYFWDPASLTHDTGPHVECIARAERLAPTRMSSVVPGLRVCQSTDHATLDWIKKIHLPRYVEFVQQTCEGGGGLLDSGDTVVSPESFAAALAAVNLVLSAADLIAGGGVNNAFCATRPPGHHALPDRAMGFCLFANVAILARYLQQQHGLQKIAVVDWDVHHGNGTQDIFYEDPSVLLISLHQFPLWPGTGRDSERGRGTGQGFTINVTIPPGTNEADYLAVFDRRVLTALEEFQPDALLISAGFDAHRDDPLGSLNLTESGYAEMTRKLREVADRHCSGRIISCLEGGYNLTALENSVAAHLRALMA